MKKEIEQREIGRIELSDEHFSIYYWPGKFATGVYRSRKKNRKNRRIRPKEGFASPSKKKDAHRSSYRHFGRGR